MKEKKKENKKKRRGKKRGEKNTSTHPPYVRDHDSGQGRPTWPKKWFQDPKKWTRQKLIQKIKKKVGKKTQGPTASPENAPTYIVHTQTLKYLQIQPNLNAYVDKF